MSITLSEIKDPKLRQRLLAALEGATPVRRPPPAQTDATAPRQTPKQPLLNKTEQRCRDILMARGYEVLEQAITLRLDPPFKSYRPDLAYPHHRWGLVFVEVKGPHRFREKGIAKAALAAKTYPMFRFLLFDLTKDGWKESVLSP